MSNAPKRIASVRVLKEFYDSVLEKNYKPGKILALEYEKAMELSGKGICELLNPQDGDQ